MIDSLPEIFRIIEAAGADGWVLEPDAKRLLSLAGFDVPRFTLARTPQEAVRFAGEIGYPVVAKVVSPASSINPRWAEWRWGSATPEGWRRFSSASGAWTDFSA